MPTFDFQSPEGRKYTLTGPEGATPEQALAVLQQHLKGANGQRELRVPAPPPGFVLEPPHPPPPGFELERSPSGATPEDWGAIPLDQKSGPEAWGAIPLSAEKQENEPEFGSDEYINAKAKKYNMHPDYVRGITNSQTSEEGVKGFPILGGLTTERRRCRRTRASANRSWLRGFAK